MNKYIITLILLAFTITSNAYKNSGNKKNAKITPKVELRDIKSFEVGGLKACTVEADDEDAIAEFSEDLLLEVKCEEIETLEIVAAN